MNEIKRYKLGVSDVDDSIFEQEDESGEWYKAEDIDKLEASVLSNMQKQCERTDFIANSLRRCQADRRKLEAEVDRLLGLNPDLGTKDLVSVELISYYRDVFGNDIGIKDNHPSPETLRYLARWREGQ